MIESVRRLSEPSRDDRSTGAQVAHPLAGAWSGRGLVGARAGLFLPLVHAVDLAVVEGVAADRTSRALVDAIRLETAVARARELTALTTPFWTKKVARYPRMNMLPMASVLHSTPGSCNGSARSTIAIPRLCRLR